MKITVFTSNQSRHNYLVNLLSNISDELFVIQENAAILSDSIPAHYPSTKIMKSYFASVADAQKKIFGNSHLKKENKNIKIFPLKLGELNKCSLKKLKGFLNSDVYVIYGEILFIESYVYKTPPFYFFLYYGSLYFILDMCFCIYNMVSKFSFRMKKLLGIVVLGLFKNVVFFKKKFIL